MEVRTVVAAAAITIMMVAIIFQVVSNTANRTGNEYDERGEKLNEEFGCLFNNPEDSKKCKEDTSYKPLNNASGVMI